MMLTTSTKQYNLNERTYIMGILNVTPDSFSDGGKYISLERAVEQAKRMEAEGADIIDVGGESARPGHKPVTATEEIERVVPVIKRLKREIDIPISIDTYKSETAKAALEAGADILNDIWGAKKDPNMVKVAATYDVPIILMHNREQLAYDDLIQDMIADLQESIVLAKQAGVKDNQIILDPGIGFAKTIEDNYIVLQHLEQFRKQLPYPLLLATSRKSFITKVLDVPPMDRDNATGATTCLGIMKGANIIRVHDVKRNVELARMMDAMIKGGIHER